MLELSMMGRTRRAAAPSSHSLRASTTSTLHSDLEFPSVY